MTNRGDQGRQSANLPKVFMGWTAPAPGIDVPQRGRLDLHKLEEPSVMQVTIIGLDLAIHWFQVRGADANGQVVVRRRLWRCGVIAYFRSLEPCLVGLEACATAHY